LMAGPIKQALFHQSRPTQPSWMGKRCPGQPALRRLARGCNVLKIAKNQPCVKGKARPVAPYAAAAIGRVNKSQFRNPLLAFCC
jgi:hypothetical protein